jgi:hypothetical protein
MQVPLLWRVYPVKQLVQPVPLDPAGHEHTVRPEVSAQVCGAAHMTVVVVFRHVGRQVPFLSLSW